MKMVSSTSCHRLCVLLLVLALYVTVTLSLPHSLNKRQALPNCEDSRDASLVCYECAKSHREMFNNIFTYCCSANAEVRNYCTQIYTEPPKRVPSF